MGGRCECGIAASDLGRHAAVLARQPDRQRTEFGMRDRGAHGPRMAALARMGDGLHQLFQTLRSLERVDAFGKGGGSNGGGELAFEYSGPPITGSVVEVLPDVNGQPVAQRAPLGTGDEVGLAGFRLHLTYPRD